MREGIESNPRPILGARKTRPQRPAAIGDITE
jgi:hypothetical protein